MESTSHSPLSTMMADERSPLTRISRLIRKHVRSMSDLRDVVLMTASLCYAAGYLSWSVHAWVYNLGLLPALRLQYLVAGVIPLALFALLLTALWALFWIRRRVMTWNRSSRRWRRAVSLTLQVIATVSLVVFIFSARIGKLWPAAEDAVQQASMWTMLVTIFFWPAKPMSQQGLLGTLLNDSMLTSMAKVFRWYAVAFGLLLATLLPLVFLFDGYIQIPQAFGGAKPRHALLTVPSGALPEALHGIAGPGPTAELRTLELHVFHDNGARLLVKPPRERHDYRTPTFELRRADLVRIQWLPQGWMYERSRAREAAAPSDSG